MIADSEVRLKADPGQFLSTLTERGLTHAFAALSKLTTVEYVPNLGRGVKSARGNHMHAPARPPRLDEPSTLYRAWVVALLFLMMLSNYMDRGILAILSQPLKQDLHITDLQIGLLGGLSFALLYMFMGIPLARLSETRNRVWIITLSMVLWSGLTALCAAAQSFGQLFLLRVGVGVGEAGAGPPSQSVIADYYPPNRRATALSIYSMGLPLGGVVGAIAGGAVAQAWGWRAALLVMGAPGLLLALLLRLTVREPERGRHDAPGLGQAQAPNLLDATRRLVATPTFLFFTFGAGLSNLAGQGTGQFGAAFYVRAFHLPLAEVGLINGLVGVAAAMIGTFFGGFLGDLAGRRDARAYAWIGGAGLCAAGVLSALAYAQPTWPRVAALQFLAGVCGLLFLGPILGVNQNLSPPRMRATAVALMTVVTSGLGFGVGPVAAGFLSDRFASRAFAAAGHGSFTSLCPGGVAPAHAAEALQSMCLSASASGIRLAIISIAAGHLLGGLLFLMGSRTIRQDLARASAAPAG
jgi:MFS family permease